MPYARSEVTRQRILEAALELFREKGFEESTMREVAARTQVSTGLAYYYFKSKEEIVHAFYQRAREELDAWLEPAHAASGKFEERLSALILAKFDYFAPHRKFLGALMGHAADPAHPLSPFHENSQEIRELDQRHFERALRETGVTAPRDLEPVLPKILWMYQMGMILFWIYDRSPGQSHARQLLDKSIGIVSAFLRLSALPLTQPVRRAVIELVDLVEGR